MPAQIKNKMDKVIFLKEQGSEDIFAYFPEIEGDNKGNKTCYAHIGQHSACSLDYVKGCKLADDFEDLEIELIGLGYDLKVMNELEITYHRQPTTWEINFGEGATHYKDFTFAQAFKWSAAGWDLKKWVKCPIDGLRYYRS